MYGKRFKLLAYRGTDIYLDVSILILGPLLIWLFGLKVYPAYFDGQPASTFWLLAIGGTLGVLISLIIREKAQLDALTDQNAKPNSVTIFLFGSLMHGYGGATNHSLELRLAARRIIGVLLAAVVWAGASVLAGAMQWPSSLEKCFQGLGWFHLIMAGFNLLPALPLDGGRLWRALLWRGEERFQRATSLSAGVASGIGLTFFAVGLICFLEKELAAGLAACAFGLSLHHAAQCAYREYLADNLIGGLTVDHFMRSCAFSPSLGTSVRSLVDDYLDKYRCQKIPVQQEGKFVGCAHLHGAFRIPNDDWEKHPVRSIIEKPAAEDVTSPHSEITGALSTMLGSRLSCQAVVEDGHLKGVLLASDVLGYLSAVAAPTKQGAPYPLRYRWRHWT